MSAVSFFQTPFDQDGFLTGFGERSRMTIAHQLNSMLQDISHRDTTLRNSLLFCRQLVYMSIANKTTTTYQVKDHIRADLGVVLPESPEARRVGGDTSVFSLPPDDMTPMTSNVSLTTTITTHHTPVDHRRRTHPIGQTMQAVTAILQVLTRTCHRLAASTADPTSLMDDCLNDLQQVYQQILNLDRRDLKTLMDAFEPVLPHGRCSRLLRLPPTAHADLDLDGSEDDEGFEMEWDRRNPLEEGRCQQEELREGWHADENNLKVLAGLCSQMAPRE
jgi:hypothetical protein